MNIVDDTIDTVERPRPFVTINFDAAVIAELFAEGCSAEALELLEDFSAKHTAPAFGWLIACIEMHLVRANPVVLDGWHNWLRSQL